jgi:CubicO group peptidase (beta-lactamase class C family)
VRAQHGISGLSIAVVDDQHVVWSEGFGYSDAARHKPATPDTLYPVGSISKLFTATAVMQLVDQGAVALDAPLSRYLPQFQIRSRFTGSPPITIRSVLTHHSGLPGDLTQGMWSDASFTTVAERLWEADTAYPADLVFNYSNLGYTLLGHMIEEVTGEDFSTYLEKAVLRPLGMVHSGFVLKPRMQPLLSKAYREGRECQPLPIRDIPALGLYASVQDLSRLIQMVFAEGRPVLRVETLKAMLAVQNAAMSLDFDTHTGLGWFLDNEAVPGVGVVAGHGGTTPWSNSQLMVLPEHKLGVVVLSNTGNTRQAVTSLAEEALRLALEYKTGIRSPSRPLTTAHPGIGFGAQAGELAGRYATDLGLLAISPKRDKVCTCLTGRTFDLIPYPDGWFGVNGLSLSGPASNPGPYQALSQLRVSTIKVMGREVMVVQEGSRHARLLGEKLAALAIPDGWRRRLGKYQVLNADPGFPMADIVIHEQNGVLCLMYRMPVLSSHRIRVPIQAISDTEAVVLGLGRTRGETLRVTRVNGEERLHYSGYEMRRSWTTDQELDDRHSLLDPRRLLSFRDLGQ